MQAGAHIASRFLQVSAQHPDRIAVVHGPNEYTYGAIRMASLEMAAMLRRRYAGAAARPAAILSGRNVHHVVAILGCAIAAIPFAAIDAAYPTGRILRLLEILAPHLIINTSADPTDIGCDIDCNSASLLFTAKTQAPPQFEPPARNGDLAYLLFTSGSTGNPKCVAFPHEPLVHFIDWHVNKFDLGENDNFSMLSGLSHDPVLRDLFTPLSIGARLIIPPDDVLSDPTSMADWFRENAITVAHMTPPHGLVLSARTPAAKLDKLRYIFWGGDVLRNSLTARVSRTCPNVAHVNFYGATETPQAASFHVVGKASPEIVPIGTGIEGFKLHLLGADGTPAPCGAVGEIAVESTYLSKGYYDRGAISPLDDTRQQGAYRTGDLGRSDQNGEVTLCGRKDDQIKVRGYRVSLPEITNQIMSYAFVRQCITLAAPSNNEICSFVAPTSGTTDPQEEIKNRLREDLPPYMLPAQIRILESLPMLPNGKVDREALLRSLGDGAARRPADPPSGDKLQDLILAWQTLFPNKRVSAQSSFTSLEGDSLSYVNALLETESVLGSVPPDWASTPLAQLAANVGAKATRWYRDLDTPSFLRCAAILLVVAAHFGLVGGAGETSGLILISGFFFGKLQVEEMLSQQSSRPMARFAVRLLPPYYLVSLLILPITYDNYFPMGHIYDFLMLHDFAPYVGSLANHSRSYLWYINALVHIAATFCFVGALVISLKTWLSPRISPVALMVISLALVGFVFRFMAPVAILGMDQIGERLPSDSVYRYWFLGQLFTFTTGVALGRGKPSWIYAGLSLAVVNAVLSWAPYDPAESIAILLSAVALAFFPHLPMPQVLTRPIYLIANASLLIYLTHFPINWVLLKASSPEWLNFFVAICAGVIIWWGWTYVRRLSVTGALGRTPG